LFRKPKLTLSCSAEGKEGRNNTTTTTNNNNRTRKRIKINKKKKLRNEERIEELRSKLIRKIEGKDQITKENCEERFFARKHNC
jgi:hypothetical protein